MQALSIADMFSIMNIAAKHLINFFASKGIILEPPKDSLGNIVFGGQLEDKKFYVHFGCQIRIGDTSIDRGHTIFFYFSADNQLFVEIRGRGWASRRDVVTKPAIKLNDFYTTDSLEKIADCILSILKDKDAKYFSSYSNMDPGYDYQKTWELFNQAFDNNYVLEQ